MTRLDAMNILLPIIIVVGREAARTQTKPGIFEPVEVCETKTIGHYLFGDDWGKYRPNNKELTKMVMDYTFKP